MIPNHGNPGRQRERHLDGRIGADCASGGNFRGRDEAIVQSHTLFDGGMITPDEIQELLYDAGIRTGIMNDVIGRIARDGIYPPGAVVARGVRPRGGVPGWVEFVYIPPSHQPKMHAILSVRKGDVLAVLHPPSEGTPGSRVTGEIVPWLPGVAVCLVPGLNTAFGPDGTTVVATEDGQPVQVPDGSIEVHTTVVIPNNMDYSVGDIDFCGSLLIKGDVLGEFSIKAGGSVEVLGDVHDAVIESAGDVTIHQGFVGVGKGRITAGGTVRVRHVTNQVIKAGKDVLIETEAVNSTIEAGGRVVAPRAVITGGRLDAMLEADVFNLGNSESTGAKVRVGRRGKIIERLTALEKDARQVDRQMTEVKEAVYRLVKIKVDTGTLSTDKEQVLAKLQEVQKLLPRRLAEFQAERETLHGELQKKCDARILVRGTVQKDTMIEVNGAGKFVESALEAVTFAEWNGVLESRSL
jgi:uncharacterized protein (DUF342 family)